MKSVTALYKYHVSNLRTVDIALKTSSLNIRSAIASGNKKASHSFLCLYALLLAIWIECRLQKLLHEPKSFSDSERTRIFSHTTHLGRWKNTIDVAFCRHYGVKKITLLESKLPHSALSRYLTICSMLNKDLSPIISIRNKLAHGQWAYQLNDNADDVAQKLMTYMRTENFLSLQFKKSLVQYMTYIVNDLIVSKSTFERDFDKNYSLIEETRRNLTHRSYSKYEKQLQDKYHHRKLR